MGFVPLLWMLTGCLYGSAYPDRGLIPDTGLGSTPAGTPVTTPTIPCSGTNQGTFAQLTIHNPTAQTYLVSFMDDACTEQLLVRLDGGEQYNGQVGNHLFFVVRTENGGFVRFFGLPSGTQVSWTETLP